VLSDDHSGNHARKNLPEQKTLCARPAPTSDGTTQKAWCPIYINPHMGRLGNQGRQAPHSTDSKNLLEHHPPQHHEHSKIDEKVMDAPTNIDEPSFSAGGLAGHVILPLI
jgi:hypothetical protein